MALILIKSTGEKAESQDSLTETAKANGSLKKTNIQTHPSVMADTCMHHHHRSSMACMHLFSGSVFTITLCANNWKYTWLYLLQPFCIPPRWWKISTGWRQSSTSVKELTWRFFPPGSPQDIYWREICFRIPRERCGGRLVEIAHQEDPNCADEIQWSHDNEADPVDHPGNQEPLFILLGLREMRD